MPAFSGEQCFVHYDSASWYTKVRPSREHRVGSQVIDVAAGEKGAVDTPNGLVVPVIRDVDKKGLVELARELAPAERATPRPGGARLY